MPDIAQIAEDLSSLSVLEIADLVKSLEEKWGVSAAAPVAVAAAPAGGDAGGAPAAAEKTEFNVVLVEAGANKIAVIKEIRAVVPGLGLADAKKIADTPPAVLKEGASKEEAEEIKKKLEAAGAKVELK